MNKQSLSTLFVGVDVSLRSHYAVILDFFGNQLDAFPFQNNLSGASVISLKITAAAASSEATHVIIAMESTSFYSFHLCYISPDVFQSHSNYNSIKTLDMFSPNLISCSTKTRVG